MPDQARTHTITRHTADVLLYDVLAEPDPKCQALLDFCRGAVSYRAGDAVVRLSPKDYLSREYLARRIRQRMAMKDTVFWRRIAGSTEQALLRLADTLSGRVAA